MRKKIVAGNWKMNKNYTEAQELMHELDRYKKHNAINCEVYIAPPALYITTAKNIFLNDNVGVFAQDMSEHTSGAYTGEISADMLASVNATGAIIGHSERRQYHGETDSHCNRKVRLALDKGLVPIYCNGETLEQRKSGQHFEVIKNQTEVALFTLSAEEIKKVVIAYEPVWAIGTGETASPEQAQEIHAHIRSLIAAKYGQEVADEISILYGGSVKPDNAKEIFSKPDVDGGLIGGAALKIEDFTAIIKAFD
ncbi:triose-phosphate isomerase [Elizabethkingia ursingii]|jgi:triosephosphate isomerase|uniref:Triosephosphate isomerase n=1 Tax=Elizabethkingia ursingii TaxID=1756150 RepID=A0AAJ3NCV5_9FLAO|nr:triose-phosphate isomerase [Elizabethkingia ursingii]MDR2228881.1 triose-phosphate isomerase [Flavobacteriaceae bacterium]AQX09905.1 triose-phosphate isomerase [Elizabethkingia ursingii]KUY31478.1 triose-phosphate isomerase [Elizabethkingia ursingii]MCL1664186.1 triose-phosphate isomerase [Elizabethkingia ursingii]OPB76048.1 triose-phosphate isomerase [Elizabethkingia ursingii]